MNKREKTRRELFFDEINEVYREIVEKHKLCGGTGIRKKKIRIKETGFIKIIAKECKCFRKFELISRLVLSNISYKNLIYQRVYNKIVIDEMTKEKFDFRREIFYPYIKNLREAVCNPYGLVLLGKNGTGKTFIGCKILFHAISQGATAHYIELADFLKLLRRNFDENLDSLIQEISDVDILMIDEVGSESKRSDFSIGEFKSLLKKRVEKRIPTIIGSNYSYKDIKKKYGGSIENILESYSKVLNFAEAPNVRRLKGQTETVSFFKKLKE